jgi:predicted sulfurtransferase
MPNYNEDDKLRDVDKKKKKKDKKKDKKKKSKKRKQSDDENNADEATAEVKAINLKNEADESKRKKLKKNNSGDENASVNDNDDREMSKKEKKRLKKEKKRLKKEKKDSKNREESMEIYDTKEAKSKDPKPQDITATPNQDDLKIVGGRIVSFSASIINETDEQKIEKKNISSEAKVESTDGVTLLLFYQYIEPMLNETEFQELLSHVETTAEKYSITGRARTACEGLNCTLTGSYENIRLWCKSLRSFGNGKYFANTEFKLTDNLPEGQAFKTIHAFKVDEIVNYGLAGERAPKVDMSGVHLEPKDYHQKMMEDNTVIIDVRNHYEAAIGKFTPPSNGAKYIDPLMRKSTEFPVWLDKPETKDMLKGKQVLMYCTGGVRCERASALLKTKIETEEDTKALGIKGVFQLQGGIDKYFRDFPEGGWWQGKNYVFGKWKLVC